jgi:hypothetical protein
LGDLLLGRELGLAAEEERHYRGLQLLGYIQRSKGDEWRRMLFGLVISGSIGGALEVMMRGMTFESLETAHRP